MILNVLIYLGLLKSYLDRTVVPQPEFKQVGNSYHANLDRAVNRRHKHASSVKHEEITCIDVIFWGKMA